MTRLCIWGAVFAVAIVAAMCGAYLRRHAFPRQVRIASIVFPSLADGDCAIVQTPDHRIIVIDAGGPASGDQVARTIRKMHGDQIDLLILASNQDTGLGGVPALLSSDLPVRSIWNSAAPPDDPTMRKVLQRIQARHIPYLIVHAGEARLSQSGVRLSVIWPPEHSPRADTDGLAVRVDYGNNSAVLLGPLAASSEPFLISGAGQRLSCDVLQVNEHGAEEGTSLELLRRATPAKVVISCNAASPPSPGVLHRLQAADAAIWRTDRQGTIVVTMDSRTPPQINSAQ
jgi:competence protein ComEC